MTQEEILYFNKRCSEFIGSNVNHWGEVFDTDWNWIMEVVEAIEKTYDEFHGYFGVFINSHSCTIQGTKLRTNPENPHYAYFNEVTRENKREATVQAINQFLIWYNEKLKTI